MNDVYIVHSIIAHAQESFGTTGISGPVVRGLAPFDEWK
jgi:hypothetical protein